jgi:hypothetical protein
MRGFDSSHHHSIIITIIIIRLIKIGDGFILRKKNPKGMMEETEKTDIGVGGELLRIDGAVRSKLFLCYSTSFWLTCRGGSPSGFFHHKGKSKG